MTKFSANYSWLVSKFDKVLQSHQELGKAVREAGPIDEKTAHLIQLAAAAAVRSEGGVHSHVKRGLQAGATADELYHSLILLTSTIGFPTVAASLSWAREVIES